MSSKNPALDALRERVEAARAHAPSDDTYVTLAYTASGALYAWTSKTLVRVKGYDIRVYQLESGIHRLSQGQSLRALVMQEDGGCYPVVSTPLVYLQPGHLYSNDFNNLSRYEARVLWMLEAADAVAGSTAGDRIGK